ncbi:transposase [Thorsellia anophelis DSM 18579]|uniref:Transposase n=1 Tax=Thorsellia anophelis DSM 18579 TaxID=1123402 RepID=A0A1I0C2R7_9GAMM|nr:transposase [Thorsellia anophelis DSM 18579]
MKFFSECEPCLIGIEACSSAHYWARTLNKLGHTVKLIAPQKVKPYVTGHKNDMRDAEAICEAVSRPHMTFVEVKSEEQQARLVVHKIRQQQIKERTALINAIRGLLSEFGYHTKRGLSQVRPLIASVLEPEIDVPWVLKQALEVQKLMLDNLDEAIDKLTKIIASHADSDYRVKQLQAIEGIGPITASALVSTLGNGSQYKFGREFAANLGLVPNQHSSGGKTRLGSIIKRGDSYLRTFWFIVLELF